MEPIFIPPSTEGRETTKTDCLSTFLSRNQYESVPCAICQCRREFYSQKEPLQEGAYLILTEYRTYQNHVRSPLGVGVACPEHADRMNNDTVDYLHSLSLGGDLYLNTNVLEFLRIACKTCGKIGAYAANEYCADCRRAQNDPLRHEVKQLRLTVKSLKRLLTPEQKVELEMSKTEESSLLSEAKTAMWRLGAKSVTDALTEPLAAALLAAMPASSNAPTLEQIRLILKSDLGKSFVAGILGILGKVMPVPGLPAEHADRLGKELREHAMYLGGGVLMDHVMGPFYEAVGKFAVSHVPGLNADTGAMKALGHAIRMEAVVETTSVGAEVKS